MAEGRLTQLCFPGPGKGAGLSLSPYKTWPSEPLLLAVTVLVSPAHWSTCHLLWLSVVPSSPGAISREGQQSCRLRCGTWWAGRRGLLKLVHPLTFAQPWGVGWVTQVSEPAFACPSMCPGVLCVRRRCHNPTTQRQVENGAVELPHGQHQLWSLLLIFFKIFFPPALITEFPYHQFPASQHLTGKAVATVLAAAI